MVSGKDVERFYAQLINFLFFGDTTDDMGN